MKRTNCILLEADASPTFDGLTLEVCLHDKTEVGGVIRCGLESTFLDGRYKVMNFKQSKDGKKRFYVLEEVKS